MLPEYKRIEAIWDQRLQEHFNYQFCDRVKEYDNAALPWEWENVLKAPPVDQECNDVMEQFLETFESA